MTSLASCNYFPFSPEHCGVVLCRISLREDGSGSAYDKESMAIIKLNNTTVLYLKEVTKFLALVCILREESFERKGKLSEKCDSPCDSSGLIWPLLCGLGSSLQKFLTCHSSNGASVYLLVYRVGEANNNTCT